MSGVLQDISVAILAGGLATRLGSITAKIPKSLLPVAGKPFLAHQLALLHRQGVRHVVLCVGHLGDAIRRAFGDGKSSGVKLDYSSDGPVLLGTGGAIQKALPLLGERFFVLYGDSYLPVALKPILAAFGRSGKRGLMTVYRNEGRYDTSNVWFDGGQIKAYDKTKRLEQMQHIDYGLSLFTAAAFADTPAGTAFDLSEVMQRLLARGLLAGYEVKKRFYEIGSPAGLEELSAMLTKQRR